MLIGDSYRAYPETPFASKDRKPVLSAQQTPRQNRLLAALPLEDYERLLPKLELVPLPADWIIHTAGALEKYVFFLTEGFVCRVYVTETGASARLGLTGREGVIGVAAVLGGESTPTQAVVLGAGYAYRLRADALNDEFSYPGALVPLLLRYTQALIAQTAQIAVCNRHHTLEQQLCRWLLGCADRSPSNKISMTQELIANMLGVRREGVTEAAGHLQAAGLIHYNRGHITVLDRPGLEARSCECRKVVRREYARLIPGFVLAPARLS